jgi:plastocyanin
MAGTRYKTLGRVALLVALLAIVALVAGCGGSGSTSGSGGTTAPSGTGGASGGSTGGSTVAVTEQNFAFSPSTVSAKVGDTVTFTNNDTVTHEVKIDGKDLGQQAPGASVSWTASKAGSYPFSCIIHPQMTGTVTVQ